MLQFYEQAPGELFESHCEDLSELTTLKKTYQLFMYFLILMYYSKTKFEQLSMQYLAMFTS